MKLNLKTIVPAVLFVAALSLVAVPAFAAPSHGTHWGTGTTTKPFVHNTDHKKGNHGGHKSGHKSSHGNRGANSHKQQ